MGLNSWRGNRWCMISCALISQSLFPWECQWSMVFAILQRSRMFLSGLFLFWWGVGYFDTIEQHVNQSMVIDCQICCEIFCNLYTLYFVCFHCYIVNVNDLSCNKPPKNCLFGEYLWNEVVFWLKYLICLCFIFFVSWR